MSMGEDWTIISTILFKTPYYSIKKSPIISTALLVKTAIEEEISPLCLLREKF